MWSFSPFLPFHIFAYQFLLPVQCFRSKRLRCFIRAPKQKLLYEYLFDKDNDLHVPIFTLSLKYSLKWFSVVLYTYMYSFTGKKSMSRGSELRKTGRAKNDWSFPNMSHWWRKTFRYETVQERYEIRATALYVMFRPTQVFIILRWDTQLLMH
jgi:hypothetical protein